MALATSGSASRRHHRAGRHRPAAAGNTACSGYRWHAASWHRRDRLEDRRLDPAALECIRTARRETRSQAADSTATAAGPGCPRSAFLSSSVGRLSINSRVYGWRGCSSTSSTGPCSTSRPAYSTPMVSANWAIRPMSWPISSTAACKPCCRRPKRQHDLALDDHVKGAGRLVGDDDPGLERRRDGHRRALPLAAAQLVRIAVRHTGRQADLGQSRGDALGDTRPRGLALMRQDAVGDLVADAHDRVQRVHRRLRDQRDLAHAHLAHARARRLQKVVAVDARYCRRRCAPAAGAGARSPCRASSCPSRTRRSGPSARRPATRTRRRRRP